MHKGSPYKLKVYGGTRKELFVPEESYDGVADLFQQGGGVTVATVTGFRTDGAGRHVMTLECQRDEVEVLSPLGPLKPRHENMAKDMLNVLTDLHNHLTSYG